MATIAGLFPDRGTAENAIQALRDAGFNQDRIGIVMRDQRETLDAGSEAATDTAAGAVTGGVIGGTLGAILAATGALVIPGIGPFIAGGILATALVGGVAGWLVGGLVALGIPREEAEYYQGQVEEGRVLVTVDAAGREDEARDVLLRNGAMDLRGATGTNVSTGTGDAYQGVPGANQPVNAATTPMPGQPLGASGNVAPETLPPDTVYETSATNPRGYATEPVSNKPDNAGQPVVNPTGTAAQPLPNEQTAAAQRSGIPAAPDEGDAPCERVILPPEFVPHPRAAENYGVSNPPDEREPDQGAHDERVGSSAPSANDAVPLAGQAPPRPYEQAPNPYAPRDTDAADGESGMMRDDDIIRQEEKRTE